MPIAKFQDSTCSVARSLSVLGERWTLLILRFALEGETRFEVFRECLGLAPDVLTERLNTMVEYGVMSKEAYQEPGRRSRYEYRLTEAGRELHVVIGGLQQWGDAHLPGDSGPTVVRQTRKTSKPVRVAFVDDRGQEVPLDQVDTLHTASHPTENGPDRGVYRPSRALSAPSAGPRPPDGPEPNPADTPPPPTGEAGPQPESARTPRPRHRRTSPGASPSLTPRKVPEQTPAS
jgi:DNA-binding HxlR family transcriptional regulator